MTVEASFGERLLAWKHAGTSQDETLGAHRLGARMIQIGILVALPSVAAVSLAGLWAMAALSLDHRVGLRTAGLLGLAAALGLAELPLGVGASLVGLGAFVAGFARTVYVDLPGRLGPRERRPLAEALGALVCAGALEAVVLAARRGERPELLARLRALRGLRFVSGRRRAWTNWASTERWLPAEVHYPTSSAELASRIAEARAAGRKVRAVGTAYAWSAIATSEELLVCLCLMREVSLDTSDPERPLAHVEAGADGRALNRVLERAGYCMPTGVVMETVSWGGQIAVGAHGSGRLQGTLSDLVEAIELVDGTGQVRRFVRGREPEDLFEAVAVSLGTCGVITHLTLRVEPAFNVRLEEEWVPLEGAMADIRERVLGNDYLDVYLMGHSDQVWFRAFNRTAEARTRRLPQMPWEQHSDRNTWGLWISTLQHVLGTGLLHRPQDWSPRLAPLFGWVFSVFFLPRTLVCPIERATHFHAGIETYTMGCGEVGFAVDDEFESVQRAWAMVQDANARWAARGRYPMNMTLNLRFVGPSEALLSTAGGNQLTCYIEILGGHRTEDWQPYLAEVMGAWLAELPRARPHWGKQLRGVPGLDEALARNLGPELVRLFELRAEHALDPDDLFISPALERLLVEPAARYERGLRDELRALMVEQPRARRRLLHGDDTRTTTRLRRAL